MSKAFDSIVMAGGRGTRLLPYTTILPKPLMPLGDAPVLEFLLRHMHRHGSRNVCLAVNHLHHLISSFFGNGSALGLNISYAVEGKPLGTCGPVAQVIDDMASHFLLLNGDIVTDLDLSVLQQHHRESGASATVAVMRRVTQLEYGVLDTDDAGRVKAIHEKPSMEHLVSMGIYMLDRDAIRPFLNANEPLDMPTLLGNLIENRFPVRAYFTACQWLDIGHPAEYELAQRKFGGGEEASSVGSSS